MAITIPSQPITSTFVTVHGMTMHVVQAGDDGAPLVLLLHGFPEFWYGWRHQISALAAAGFRVWAPDQRGYNLTDKPYHIDAYRLDHLAGDAAALIDLAGVDSAYVVGHDWGAIVAWYLAMTQPQWLIRLAILNVPHPKPFEHALRTNPRQILRSTYAAFFQLPALPEALLRMNNFAVIKNGMRGSSLPGTFSDTDFAIYEQAWEKPRAIRSGLNWYRALVRYRPPLSADLRIHVPTLILWGEKDVALIPELAAQSAAMCDDAQLVMMPDATHWLHHEYPERINAHLIEFFKAN